jgi:hypothetical protein
VWLGGAFDCNGCEGKWEKVGFGRVVENVVLETQRKKLT